MTDYSRLDSAYQELQEHYVELRAEIERIASTRDHALSEVGRLGRERDALRAERDDAEARAEQWHQASMNQLTAIRALRAEIEAVKQQWFDSDLTRSAEVEFWKKRAIIEGEAVMQASEEAERLRAVVEAKELESAGLEIESYHAWLRGQL